MLPLTSTFYEITPSDDCGVVMTPDDLQDPHQFGYRLDLEPGRIEEAPELRWLSDSNTVVDWPFTVNAMRLVSERVREIFEAHSGPRDEIQWLPASVTTNDGTDHQYWVPHFPVWHDVLDEELTNRGPNGMVIRWIVARSKLDGLNAFVVPRTTFSVVVRDTLYAALQEAGITGTYSQPARQV